MEKCYRLPLFQLYQNITQNIENVNSHSTCIKNKNSSVHVDSHRKLNYPDIRCIYNQHSSYHKVTLTLPILSSSLAGTKLHIYSMVLVCCCVATMSFLDCSVLFINLVTTLATTPATTMVNILITSCKFCILPSRMFNSSSSYMATVISKTMVTLTKNINTLSTTMVSKLDNIFMACILPSILFNSSSSYMSNILSRAMVTLKNNLAGSLANITTISNILVTILSTVLCSNFLTSSSSQ